MVISRPPHYYAHINYCSHLVTFPFYTIPICDHSQTAITCLLFKLLELGIYVVAVVVRYMYVQTYVL